MLDLVYPLRPGPPHEELRFSLRSAEANLPHGRVWTVGARPRWAAGEVGYIPVERRGTKYVSSTANVLAACRDRRVGDSFVLMNDDFFVLRPIPAVPMLHRGPVREVIADYERRHLRSKYLDGMRETASLLATLGHPDPLSYELHAPMIVNRHLMGEILARYADAIPVLHKRTLYGNLAHAAGVRHLDVKIESQGPVDPRAVAGTFLSTGDQAFRMGEVGAWLRARFATPSAYERRAEAA